MKDLQYREAIRLCLDRYEQMAQENPLKPSHFLLTFIDEFRSVLDTYPLTKLNRWLGYIQGVLIERGDTTVEAERDWTPTGLRWVD